MSSWVGAAASRARKARRWQAAIVVAAVMMAGVVGYLWFFTYHLRPEGELVQHVEAPLGDWAYRLYAVDYRGAAGSPLYRVEVVSRVASDSPRIIYYEGGRPRMEWLDHTTLRINGRALDVRTDTYEADDTALERAANLGIKLALMAALMALVGLVVGYFLRGVSASR